MSTGVIVASVAPGWIRSRRQSSAFLWSWTIRLGGRGRKRSNPNQGGIHDSSTVLPLGVRFLIISRRQGFARPGSGADAQPCRTTSASSHHSFLNNTQVTGSGLNQLANLHDLVSIDLSGTALTDAGAKGLAFLTSLTAIDLSDTSISDAGVKQLSHLKQLWAVRLQGAKLTDAGLKELTTLVNITDLDLRDTKVGSTARVCGIPD